jgi:hypothetical protein
MINPSILANVNCSANTFSHFQERSSKRLLIFSYIAITLSFEWNDRRLFVESICQNIPLKGNALQTHTRGTILRIMQAGIYYYITTDIIIFNGESSVFVSMQSASMLPRILKRRQIRFLYSVHIIIKFTLDMLYIKRADRPCAPPDRIISIHRHIHAPNTHFTWLN